MIIKVNLNITRHPQIIKLSRQLEISSTEAIGYIMKLYSFASKFSLEYEPEEISDGCDFTKKERDFVKSLIDCGFIEEIPGGFLLKAFEPISFKQEENNSNG